MYQLHKFGNRGSLCYETITGKLYAGKYEKTNFELQIDTRFVWKWDFFIH